MKKISKIVLILVPTLFALNIAFSQAPNQQCYGNYGCFPKISSAEDPIHIQVYNGLIDLLIKKIETDPNMPRTFNGYTGDIDAPTLTHACATGMCSVVGHFMNGILTSYSCVNSSTWNFILDTSAPCGNGATGSQCNICPSGLAMQNNLCVCANGATNPTACSTCPSGSNMVNGMCTCSNNADVFAQCNNCSSGQVFNSNGQCVDGCSTTNACGQTITGVMNNGRCELSTTNGADPNASCILDFNVTTNTVNPNGSVEFSWSLANLPSNIKSKCGFVDLTTSTPRPIPGLQNLDPNTDRVRINNVQSTTRFCLVCQYYNLLQNNALLGEAVKHQWVRVIKVNEN